MAHIDEKTKISLFAVVCSVPFLIAGILWLASVDATAKSADEEVKALRPMIIKLLRGQARIEQKLKIQNKDE